MATMKISLRVKTLAGGDRIVVAKDDDGTKKGGNVGAERGDKIVWSHAGGTPNAFLVTFVNFDSGSATWPFFGNPDVEASKGLLVPAGDTTVEKTFKVRVPVKYDVAVRGDTSVEPLDPMIIVRDRALIARLAPLLASGLVGALLSWLVFGGSHAG